MAELPTRTDGRGFEPQARFTMHIAPARAAYLIRAGSRSGLRRSVQEATTRWGGAMEPIIPVRSRAVLEGWWQQVIETMRPDGFVNVDVTEAEAQAIADRFQLGLTPIAQIDRTGRTRWCANPAATWYHPADTPVGSALLASPRSGLWEAIAGGDLLPAAENWAVDEGVPYRRASNGLEIAQAQVVRSTALDRTTDQLPMPMASGCWPAPVVIWVTRRSGYRDLISYWNVRAMRDLGHDRSLMALIADSPGLEWSDLRDAILNELRRPINGEPDVVLVSHTVDEERLRGIAVSLGLRPASSFRPSSINFPRAPLRTPPFTYMTNIDPRHFVLFDRTYGASTQGLARDDRDGVELDLGCPVSLRAHGYTLARLKTSAFDALPKHPQVAEEILPDAWWDEGSMCFATNLQDRYTVRLRSLSLSQAVWTTLRCGRTGVELSDKGKLAEAVERALGSEVLDDPRALQIIRQLTTPRTKHQIQAIERWRADGLSSAEIEILTNAATGRTDRSFRSAAELKEFEVLEALAAAGYLERGFVIRCTLCAITSFIPLESVRGSAECPACRTPQRYRTSSGPSLHYRLHGLIDRASDQGALLHLRVRRQLLGAGKSGYLLPGVLADGSEVDLFGVVDGKIVAGEAKSTAPDFTATQIERDMELTVQLGAQLHVAGCAGVVDVRTEGRLAREAKRRRIGLTICDADGARPVPLAP